MPGVHHTQLQDKFVTAHVSGDKLLSLDDTDLQRIAPDLKKKIGRRKKFMARVQPLRMGFLAWNVDDAVRWLEVHNLLDMETVFREARVSPLMIVVGLIWRSLSWVGAASDRRQAP